MSDVLMQKDGRREQVPSEEVPVRLAGGWTRVEPRSAYQVFTDHGTGEQRLRRLTIDDSAAGTTALERQDVLTPTPELEELYAAQRERDEEEARREALGGIGGAVREGVTSALDEMTFGVITDGMRRASPGYGEDRDASMAIHPRSHIGGRVLGIAGSVALPAPAWGRGFMGAGGAGAAAGQAAGRLLGRAGAGRNLTRLVGGTVEGGVGGALDAVTEANITGDHEGLAERMLASGTLGAVLGFGVETGGILRQFVSRERRAIAESAGAADNVEGQLAALAEGQDSDGFAANIQRMFGGTPAPSRRVVRDAEDVIRAGDRFWSEFAQDAQGRFDASDRILQEFSVDALMRNGSFRKAMAAVDPRAVQRHAERLSSQMGDVIRGMERDGVSGQAHTLASRVRDAVSDPSSNTVQELMTVRQQVTAALSGTGNKGLAHFDKRALEMLAQNIDSALHAADMGDLGRMLQAREQVFGQAIAARDGFADLMGNSLRPGSANFSVLAAELKRLAESGSSQAVNSLRQLSDTLEQAGDAARILGVNLDGMSIPDPERLLRQLRLARNHQKFQSAYKQQMQHAGIGAALGVGAVGAVALGNPLAGLALGAAVLSLTKPANTARMLENFRRLFRKQESRIGEAYEDVSSAIRTGTRPRGSVAAAAGTIANVFMNAPTEERRKNYEELATRIEKLALNPDLLHQEMQLESLGADAINPQLPTSLGGGAMRGIGALLNALPPSRRSRRRGGFTEIPALTLPASETEMDDFLEAAAVVEDPIFGVELMAAGRLGNSGARALEGAYPAFHAAFASAVMQDYTAAYESGETIDYSMSVQMSNLLGMPMDPSLEPDFILSQQETYAQTGEQDRAVRSPAIVAREMNNLAASHTRVTSQALEQYP